jgi:hypothetical protein
VIEHPPENRSACPKEYSLSVTWEFDIRATELAPTA